MRVTALGAEREPRRGAWGHWAAGWRGRLGVAQTYLEGYETGNVETRAFNLNFIFFCMGFIRGYSREEDARDST